MTWHGNVHRVFATIADALVQARVPAEAKTAVLNALIDHIGMPPLDAGRLADRYRHDPTIRALFAARDLTRREMPVPRLDADDPR